MTFKFDDAVIRSHTAVVGKTGAGKTSTEKLLVEQVVAEEYRVCILDTIKSDWWGITLSGDGKRPGLPFKILGGPRGHVGLPSSAGKAVGQLVGSGKLPLSIIDMADFEAGGVQRFWNDFAPALLRSMKGVVYLVIEEAHEIAPKERAGLGNENLAIHWAKKLATAGRSKGIRLVVATQRTQALHNAVLGSCETIIAHRLTTPADQEPILKWLKANTDKATIDKVAASLSSLPTGTGLLCSGEASIFEQVKFPRFKTFDNAATPTKDGTSAAPPADHVTADEKLRELIGDAVAEAEANDPRLLKSEIARLKNQISARATAAPIARPEPDQAQLDALYSQGMRDGYERGLAVGINRGQWSGYADCRALFISHLDKLTEVATLSRDRLAAYKDAHVITDKKLQLDLPNAKPFRAPVQAPAARIPSQVSRVAPSSAASGDGTELPKGEDAILRAVAQYDRGVTRELLSILTGYKKSSRDAYLQRLLSKGMIEIVGGNVVATSKAHMTLPRNFERLPTGKALLDYWLRELPEGEGRILEVLAREYPNDSDREAISAATDYKKSSRDAYLQRLRTRKLITVDRDGIRAADILFDA